MDSDAWDTRYVFALFKAMFTTLLILVTYLFFNLFYNYFKYNLLKIIIPINSIIFYTGIIIIFLIIAIIFIFKIKNDI